MSLNHEINLTIPESHFAHYGCELFVFYIDGESFKPIGSFGKDRFMLAKSNGFNVHYPLSSKVEAPMRRRICVIISPATLTTLVGHLRGEEKESETGNLKPEHMPAGAGASASQQYGSSF